MTFVRLVLWHVHDVCIFRLLFRHFRKSIVILTLTMKLPKLVEESKRVYGGLVACERNDRMGLTTGSAHEPSLHWTATA